jgi:hypothetical protein
VSNSAPLPGRQRNFHGVWGLFFGIYLALFLIIAVVAGFSACAGTQVQNKESLLSAAGFRTRTPSTQEQWDMFNRMTPYKFERNAFKGKALYTYSDTQKGVVYIGGDKAYQRYKQLGIQQSLAQKELEASYSNYLATDNQVWDVHDGYP